MTLINFGLAGERATKTAFLRSDARAGNALPSPYFYHFSTHTHRENQETRCEPPPTSTYLAINGCNFDKRHFNGSYFNVTQSERQFSAISSSEGERIWRMKLARSAKQPRKTAPQAQGRAKGERGRK